MGTAAPEPGRSSRTRHVSAVDVAAPGAAERRPARGVPAARRRVRMVSDPCSESEPSTAVLTARRGGVSAKRAASRRRPAPLGAAPASASVACGVHRAVGPALALALPPSPPSVYGGTCVVWEDGRGVTGLLRAGPAARSPPGRASRPWALHLSPAGLGDGLLLWGGVCIRPLRRGLAP